MSITIHNVSLKKLIKTITNRYLKSMPDKWFHVYVSSDSINVCWIRSQTDNSMNYSKTFALTDSEIKKLTEWLVVTTGFPKAKILLEIEAPFNLSLIHI